MILKRLLCTAAGIGLAAAGIAECFDFSSLPPELQTDAEQILLAALDSEALYTFVGIKPMSSGFASASIPLAGSSEEQLDSEIVATENLRLILETFECGTAIEAALLPFRRQVEGDRRLEAYLFARNSVGQVLRDAPGFWAYYGVTPTTPAAEVVLAFESDPTVQRFRAFGRLFGYPEHAVDFFVQAELSKRETGLFTQRDFFQIPSFERETGAFVYAVPPGHTPTQEDLELKRVSEIVLEDYRQRRSRYIGEGKPGAAELVRDWLQDDSGRFSVEVALAKSMNSQRIRSRIEQRVAVQVLQVQEFQRLFVSRL